MRPPLAARMPAVQPPLIPIIGELIRQNPGTISLGQGMVWYGPPPQARERLAEALASADTNVYGDGDGVPRLLALLEAKLASGNGIAVRPASRLMVTAGANMAFLHAILAVTDPGDEVILPVPYYFNHEMAIVMAGARPVPVPTDARYQLDLDAIAAAITPRTRAVVTVSPNNPSGAVYPEEALRAVNTLCRDHGLFHLADEVYEHFLYGGARHFSPGSIPGAADHTFTFYSFSKDYGMAGWRVGYMVMPAWLHAEVAKIQDTVVVCPPVASQAAAIGALEAGTGFVAGKLAELAEVRQRVIDAFRPISDRCELPAADGAIYCLARLRDRIDPMVLVERLIREFRVAVIPGTTFGLGGTTIRLSYGALGRAMVAEGIGRLVAGLSRL